MSVKSFRQKIKDIKNTDEYWIEKALVDFSFNLHEVMADKGISKAEFARKIGKSNAYVTKALRGDENFTIKTMVKFARALGVFLHLKVDDEPQSFVWKDVVKVKEREVFVPVYVPVVTGGADMGIESPSMGAPYQNDATALAA